MLCIATDLLLLLLRLLLLLVHPHGSAVCVRLTSLAQIALETNGHCQRTGKQRGCSNASLTMHDCINFRSRFSTGSRESLFVQALFMSVVLCSSVRSVLTRRLLVGEIRNRSSRWLRAPSSRVHLVSYPGNVFAALQRMDI